MKNLCKGIGVVLIALWAKDIVLGVLDKRIEKKIEDYITNGNVFNTTNYWYESKEDQKTCCDTEGS